MPQPESKMAVTRHAPSPAEHAARVLVLLCAALCCACRGTTRPAPKGPTRLRGLGEPTATAPESASTRPSGSTQAQLEVPLQTAQGDEAKKKEDAGKRNFGAELSRAMGAAASCLKPRVPDQVAAMSLDISLTANVTPSGAVSRGEVRHSQLDPDELACLRRQVEAVHFALPIEHAPFAVNALVKVQLQVAAQNAAAPQPKPADEKPYWDTEHPQVAPTPHPEAPPAAHPEAPPAPMPAVAPNTPAEVPPTPYPAVPPTPP